MSTSKKELKDLVRQLVRALEGMLPLSEPTRQLLARARDKLGLTPKMK